MEVETAVFIAPERESDEDQGDLVAVADGSQGIFPREFPCYQTVGYVVELLEYDTAEKGHTELP